MKFHKPLFPTFRDNFSIPPSKVRNSNRILTDVSGKPIAPFLKDHGSKKNPFFKGPDELISNLFRGGSLKSRKVKGITCFYGTGQFGTLSTLHRAGERLSSPCNRLWWPTGGTGMALLSLIPAPDGCGWSTPHPDRFNSGKGTRYPPYGIRGRPQRRSGRVRNISPSSGFDTRTSHSQKV